MELSGKLLQRRKELGWTQAFAAKKISIQQSYLSKLESGQYDPSEKVINQLCSAYNIKRDDLFPTSNKNISIYRVSIISGIMGLVLLLIGGGSLIFHQTYYTYKITHLSSQELIEINYHVTDHYKGEKYNQSFKGKSYEYSLVGQRDISRAENRWLIAFGCLFIFISLLVVLCKLKIFRKKV